MGELYRAARVGDREAVNRLADEGLVEIETRVRANYTHHKTIAKAEILLALGVVDFRFHEVIVSLTKAGLEAWRLRRLG